MIKKQKLGADEIGTLVLLAAIIFGAWFRVMPAWYAGFPVNDGGLFYTMMRDVQANHYFPPLYTTYNNLNIPFAYPPLGLYVGALIGGLFNVSLLEITRWLPGIINALCVPAFYFLAKEILSDKLQSASAALVYALIPHLTLWFSMGGGLTRSFGGLFMLITLAYADRVFAREDKKSVLLTIVFGSLTVLSHTEAPIYTIALAIYIWAMKSRSLKGLLNGALIALGVTFLAGGWYGWVIYSHGFAPITSASQTGLHTNLSLLKILNVDFMTEEFYADIFGVLGILGMATLIAKKDFFIPGMLVVIFLAQPRSAHTMGNIALALAAGYFVVEILMPPISKFTETSPQSRTLFLVTLIPYILSNSMFFGLALSQKHVPKPEQDAMQWVKETTPPNSKFLVLTGETNPFCDATSEWFPALTERKSLATFQGNEWVLGASFGKFIGNAQNFQRCINQGLDCMERGANYFGSFNYVYISVAPTTVECQLAGVALDAKRPLIVEMENSTKYVVAYRSKNAVIFEMR